MTRPHRWLAAVPAVCIFLGVPFASRVRTYVLGLPFMLAWANGPWTRRWDGMERDVLQPQEYGEEGDWRAHFELLRRFFDDPRYVRVNDALIVHGAAKHDTDQDP